MLQAMTSNANLSRHEQHGGAAEGARSRRERLHHVMTALEETLASPARARFRPWREQLVDALHEVHDALRDHVAETEADDGLFVRTLGDAPRLAHAVEHLRRQHVEISTQTDELTQRVKQAGEDDVDSLRQLGTNLLVLLARHRQLGADLLYEAYFVDVGVGD